MKEHTITIQVDELESGEMEVRIGSYDKMPPLAVFVAAAENIMNMVAIESNAGYDEALALLVEGAKKTKTLHSPSHTIQ